MSLPASTRTGRLALLGGALTALLVPAAAQLPIGPPGGGAIPVPPPTPAPYVPGPFTILVQPGMVTVVATGQTFTTYNLCGTGPILNAVAFALRIAVPGDVLGVTGTHPGIIIKPNPNPCRQDECGWASNVVQDVDIVGADSSATIDGVFIQGDYTVAGQGGVDRITFQNLRLRNSPFARAPFQTDQVGRNGRVRIYGCLFDSVDPNAWSGHGAQFGLRGYLTSWDIRDCQFTDSQEHCVYVDSPGFDQAYPNSMILVGNSAIGFTGRTGVQIVNRINPASGYTGASGRGTVLIRNNSFKCDSTFGGGHAVTIAGHWGNVWVENNTLEINDIGPIGGSSDQGGILAWNPGATWEFNGYTTKFMYVKGNNVFGTGTRGKVTISDTQTVWVDVNTLQGPGNGVEFETPGGGGANGSESLPPSTMAGWLTSGCKALDVIGGVWRCLTNTEIDTLY
jgi:hypothetical protein